MFPDEPTLIARGKYSTLMKERKEQIKRVQEICRTIQGNATLILTDSQKKPPDDARALEETIRSMENLKAARERIVTLSLGLIELEPEAWPK
jgi:precorrin-6B methylase 1